MNRIWRLSQTPQKKWSMLEKWFGAIPRGADVLPVAPPSAMLTGVTSKTLQDRVGLPRVYLAWLPSTTGSTGISFSDWTIFSTVALYFRK